MLKCIFQYSWEINDISIWMEQQDCTDFFWNIFVVCYVLATVFYIVFEVINMLSSLSWDYIPELYTNGK